MKTKDFDRLKELIEKEGFQLKYRIEKDKTLVVVDKVERIDVKYIDWYWADRDKDNDNISLIFRFSNWSKVNDRDDLGDYLAEQLEKYLNEIK
jgi:predicted lipid-binding transport protein (Tim44 family)